MKLIDVDAFLKEFITEGLDVPACQYSEFEIFCMLRRWPAVDAVPVMRCKDCKYSEERVAICKPHNKFVICNNKQAPTNHRYFDFGDYCSYGERKDNDE